MATEERIDIAEMDETTGDYQKISRYSKKSSKTLSESYSIGWKDISYSVSTKKGTKQILNHVTGRSEPGQVTAIMGPSGSGKTTLLDVLGDRLSTGVIEGEIYVNGELRQVNTFRTISCYIPQEDSLMGSFTTLETLRFSAALSLPSYVTAKAREQRVQDAIDDMGLRECQNTIVGDLFRKGLSGGQKRRLSIAIELLARPSIMLLDEPSSGLDSASTENVIQHIVTLAKAGRSIIFTIHQPSSTVYKMFDNVGYLVSGSTVYFGAQEEAMSFFEQMGYPCPKYTNPPEHCLRLINTDFKTEANVQDFMKAYENGKTLETIRGLLEQDKGLGGVIEAGTDKLKPSPVAQFFVLMHRNTLNNIRNPGIYWVRLFMYFMLSVMLSTMYLSTNDAITENDLVPLLFYVQAFLVFMSVAVLPFFIEQRAVFLRERINSSLNTGAYVVANFWAALPGIFLIAVISTSLIVPLAGLNGYGYFLLNLFLSLVVAESLMHVISSAVPYYIIGIALGAGLFGMFMMCEGFMVPRDAIPDYWIWCYYLAFHTYSFQSFVYEHFKNDPVGSKGNQILVNLGLTNVNTDENMIILAAYAIVLQLIFAFIIYVYHTGRR